MENKKYPLILVGLVILIGVIYWFYAGLQKTPPVEKMPPVTANPTQTYINTETARVEKEGGLIPFDYQVTAVTSDRVTINGAKGEMFLTTSPLASYFWRKNGVDTPAKLSDLKIGQKLVIERLAPPARGIKVYIVGE